MKKIKNYPNYFADEQGEIYSNRRGDLKKMSKMLDNTKYYRLRIRNEDGVKTFLVHRLIALTFIPNPNNLPCVNHKDGNKLNNSVENLEWCTYSENQKHAYSTGLKTIEGENNPRNILTPEQVLRIYAELLDGRLDNDLAKQYGVAKSTIRGIQHKRNWKNLLSNMPDMPRRVSKKFSDSTVRWICEQLQAGLTPAQVAEKSTNESVTRDRVQEIRSKRSYVTISNGYDI